MSAVAWVIIAGALLIASAGSAARAQAPHDSTEIPARPKLDPGADTNSAQANYAYGMKMVSDDPQEAVRAFYWASRIDPSSGDALYALRTARLIAMGNSDLAAYLGFQRGKNRERVKRTPEQLALDSLIYRAYAVNPFLYSNIDGALVRRTIEATIVTMDPKIDSKLLAQQVAVRMRAAENQPWMAYSEGRFQDALETYALQLQLTHMFGNGPRAKNPDAKQKAFEAMGTAQQVYADVEIRAQRARIFYQLHEFDSAGSEMTAAIALLQSQDSGSVMLLYHSKAMFEQGLGIIYEHDNRLDLAREAYGHALQEDLSYYAAHSRLAQLELERGDTTAALSEMDLAVQLEPGDPSLRYRYAEVLVRARRDADAAQELRKAIALDPVYGSPHLLLATIGDLEEYTSDAIAEYRQYLALAARGDPQRPRVQMRLAKLTASMASTQPHQ